MKNILAFTVGALCVLQISVASAATVTASAPAATGMEPAISAMLGLNRWLNGNSYSGSNYINNNFLNAAHQALAWDKDAELSSFTVAYPAKSCSFVFVSLKKLDQVFQASCVDLPNQILKGAAVPATGVEALGTFAPPGKKLRDFILDFFQDTTIPRAIGAYMKGQSANSLVITLKMFNGSEVRWNWAISAVTGLAGVDVYENAMNAGSALQMTTK
jgi:hypothetical protein